MTQWKEEDKAEREEEERRRMGSRWTEEDPMDVDDVEDDDISEESENIEGMPPFFKKDLGSSFVSVSGSSKIFEESPTIS